MSSINTITITHGDPGKRTVSLCVNGDPVKGELHLTFLRVPKNKTMPDLEYRLAIKDDSLDYFVAMFERPEILDQKNKVRWSDGEVHISKRNGTRMDDIGSVACDLTVKWDDEARILYCFPGKQHAQDQPEVITFRLSPLERIRLVELVKRITNQSSMLSVLQPFIKNLLSDMGHGN